MKKSSTTSVSLEPAESVGKSIRTGDLRPWCAPFLALLLGGLAAFPAGCGDDDDETRRGAVSLGLSLDVVDPSTRSEIGKPKLLAASAVREVRRCPLINSIDTACATIEREFVDVEVEAAICTSGTCDVRRVTLEEVAGAATAAFLRADGAPPPERAVFFEVTPRAADVTFELRATLGGETKSRAVTLESLVVTGLDLAEWRAPFREVVGDVDPITLLPGAVMRVRCPMLDTRRDGDTQDGADAARRVFPSEPDDLRVEVLGEGIRTTANPTSCQSWLEIRAEAVGRADVVVKRGALTSTFPMRVASPADVKAFTVHSRPPGEIAMSPLPLQEFAGTDAFLGFGCVLELTDASHAFGGCGTLEANLESGLERIGAASAVPESDVFAEFKRVANARPGGELRGRVGTTELVLPVR